MKLKTLSSATAATAVAASLLLVPAAPAHHSAKSCRDVAFSPNSEDMAADVRARGVGCRFARDFIRDSEGRPEARYGGFRCRSRLVEPSDSLPYTRYRCTSGEGTISWKRY